MTKTDYCYRILMSAIVQQSILDYVNSLIDIYKKGMSNRIVYISKNIDSSKLLKTVRNSFPRLLLFYIAI